MSKDRYESPLASRYASEFMLHLFSADMRIQTWRKLWVSLARAEHKLGLPVTAEQVAELEAHVTDIDFDAAARREKEVRHDVMAHVYAYGLAAPSAAGIIHLGATSCYVTDNADLVIYREGLKYLRGELLSVVANLSKFAQQYKATPTLGYTHYQPAQLVTVGKRATLWMQDLVSDLEELDFVLDSIPFLGCRGLRFSLREEDMFRSHLRAVLRASAYGKAQLLLPMVTGVEEVRRAREILEEEKEALRRRKVAFDENLPMGVMVETVSACLMADAFSKEADFFSLGTNDLTQYVLGVDRGNARVAHLYSYFHPAVLRLVRQVLETARRTGTKVSMCGEAAADTALTPVLLTFGLEAFSVAPVSLLPVRKAISLWTMDEAKAVTEKAMSLETEEEIQAFLKEHEKK